MTHYVGCLPPAGGSLANFFLAVGQHATSRGAAQGLRDLGAGCEGRER